MVRKHFKSQTKLATMKLFNLTVLAALLGTAIAASPSDKQVVITFPQDTPDSIVEDAKEALRAAVSTGTWLMI